jgi:nitrogen fixation protein FixH
MTQSDIPSQVTLARFPDRWAWFPVGLLGLLVTVQVVLFKLSSGDDSFAIEPEYYQKAVNWDARAREREISERLGWQAQATIVQTGTASTLRVILLDRTAAPLRSATLAVDAFPNSRATQVQHLALREVSPGVYEGELRITHGGEWEVRLQAKRALDTFSTALRTSPATLTK